ncbi:MAG: PAS domain S-box protein [Spirochaetia bacterium]|nr:PAS domain S-box protein [Spirochaetia bacterium]
MTKKILLVEDEALIAMNEAQMLKKHGYEVVTVYNGENAIEAVEQDPEISLILMDIDLGKGMDGTEAAEKILNKKDIPIVFLSSHTELEVVEKTEKITSYGYVVKNSNPTVLDASVKMAFKLFEANRKAIEELSQRKLLETALEKRLIALTRPLDQMEQVSFFDLFDITAIQRIQDQFSKATNVASIITLPDGTPVTEPSNFTYLCSEIVRKNKKGCANCFKSDAALGRMNEEGPIIQPCLSGGLWDAGASITVGSQHIANWLIGQVRDETQTEESILRYAREIEADETELLKAFRDVPSMKLDQFTAIAQAVFSFANQLSDIAYQNVQQARFITERKQAEEKLLQREQHYRLIYNSLRDALIIVNNNREITDCNTAFTELFGYTLSEVKGKKTDILFASEDEYEQLGRMMQKQGENTDFIYQSIYRKKTGETFWGEKKLQYLIDENGKPVGFIGVIRDITKRKNAEEALRKSEKKNSAILLALPDLMFIHDSAGTYLDYYASNVDYLYVQPERFIGQKMQDVLPQEVSQHLFPLIEKTLSTKEVQLGEYELTISGEKRTFEARFSPFDENKVISIRRDITEQKKFEEELKEKKELLQNITDNITDLVALTDKNGIFKYVCSSHNFLGYESYYLLFKNVLDFVHPEDIERIEKSLAEWKKIKESQRKEEFRYRCADGSYIWVETVGKKLLDVNGEIKEIIFSSRDITERKNYDKALSKEQHYFKSILNSLPDTVYFKDKDHRFTRVNRAKLKEVASTYEDIIGKTDFDFFPEKLAQKCLADDEYVLNTGKSIIHKEEEIVSNKNRKVVLVSKFPLKDENENIIGTMGISSNISELKETEEKLQDSLKEKEFLMKELNHRVKNNLLMVSSLISLKDSETEIDLSDIQHQIEAIGLIHEKLYQTENVAEISCRDYFDDLLNSIFSSFTTRDVRIEKDIDDMYVSIKTAVSFGLIMNEMATNAIKHGFTDKEEAVFTIEMKKDTENNQYEITLTNTGNPFPEDIDIESTDTLGLRLINALVAQLDGTIELQKSPKPVFTIRFPIGEE